MKELLDLFFTFFKLGAFTFGGGYAMMSQLQELVVEKKKWITNDELLDICAIAEVTPGPVAINLSTYIGYKKKGFLGSLVSTIGVVLPSFVILFLISLVFRQFIENKFVAYAFTGINCAVALLIIRAAIKLFKQIKKDYFTIILLIISSVLLIVFNIFDIHFSSIYYILIGAVLGLIYYSCFKKAKEEIDK